MTEITVVNNNNIQMDNNNSTQSAIGDEVKLTIRMLEALRCIALKRGIYNYEVETNAISAQGENSYGLVLQVKIIPKSKDETLNCILKIAPKNPARRMHMQVAEYYSREVFMYEKLFSQFHRLEDSQGGKFNVVPVMFHYSLQDNDEFIIFEDLSVQNFKQNCRLNMPTPDLVANALEALAHLHAMSFVFQAKNPQLFDTFVSGMTDNLFTKQTSVVTIEYAKRNLSRTRVHLERNTKESKANAKLILLFHKVEQNFKTIAMHCVDGAACKPYAVICHGDCWNNNILYTYDEVTHEATSAKLVDFQMSRYASPVLDLAHYIFACTEKELRDVHFNVLFEHYYKTLAAHITRHKLDVTQIYPREIFDQQLRKFMVFGFCMGALAIPFYIANTSELIELDKVAEAVHEISTHRSPESNDVEDTHNLKDTEACLAILEEFDMFSTRTVPIYNRRMMDISKDLLKYNFQEFD